MSAQVTIMGTSTAQGDKAVAVDANGWLKVINGQAPGATNLTSTQVNASTAPATLVAARATRRSVTIKNLDTALAVWVGEATVSISTGMELKAGESIALDFAGLIQVVASTQTPRVAVSDVYD